MGHRGGTAVDPVGGAGVSRDVAVVPHYRMPGGAHGDMASLGAR